jgi:putative flippase GtrA
MLIQFIKFGIVGFSNTAISYIIYSVLVYFGLHYIIASVAAFIVSVLNSFFWNDRYVFKRRSGEKRGFWGTLLKTYVSYAFTGLVLHNILLSFFIEILRVNKFIAPLLGLAVTIPLNFVLNRKWAFKA